jgi:uncharacterized membrane protein YoaK (UPF0700 family)
MKPTLPVVLSVTGGYTDTAGFLALQGLFTAHVTGNFITFAAAWVLGTSGMVAKLLALPVFCLVALAARILASKLRAVGRPVLRRLLGLKLLLLLVAALLAVNLGPFPNGDTWSAVVTGMTLVAAMAIQNAAHRVHLSSAPPSTLMTGTTTQLMLDLADLMSGVSPDLRSAAKARIARMSLAVGAFAGGCALAAVAYIHVGMWCFCVPPLLALWSLLLSEPNALQAPTPNVPTPRKPSSPGS